MDDQVWIAVIVSDDYAEASEHRTQGGAFRTVVAFVREWWTTEFPHREEPDDDMEAVLYYFDHVQNGEFYEIVGPVAVED